MNYGVLGLSIVQTACLAVKVLANEAIQESKNDEDKDDADDADKW